MREHAQLPLIAILAVVLAMSTGVAAAAASPSLTSTEYQQLISFQAAASVGSPKTLAAVEALQTRCRTLSPVSRLMRTDRADCAASFAWVEASFKAVERLKACAHTRTIAARFGCLRGAYVRLERTVAALYRDELSVYRATVSRGFSGACERALSQPRKTLVHESQMRGDLAKMVAAMKHDNLLAVQKWGSLYDAATAETESTSSHSPSVGVCPHQ
jgi:hypothetical protein